MSSLTNSLDPKQRKLLDSAAKMFAEKLGPEFGCTNLDFSMRSLALMDGCLERATIVIDYLPTEKRIARQQAIVAGASAYIAKTLADNHQCQLARDSNGQLVIVTPEGQGRQQGWQVAASITNMVEKKLADPANESIVGRFMTSVLLGEMFSGINLSG